MSKTLANYPQLLSEWHPTKNGNLNPENISYGSAKKIWWKCSIATDHEWEDTPNHRTGQSRGCHCCAGRKIVLSNCLATLYPHVLKEWHPIKNNWEFDKIDLIIKKFYVSLAIPSH